MIPFSPSSSESFHSSSQSGESLPVSEAFLDSSSRTRDALPEQYRAHFDELRNNIFAFCDEFGIPKETLGSKEAFGTELASKKIPPARMEEAVSLFARLEHLVTNRELLKEKLPEYLEEVERLYNLTEQYTFQFNFLKKAGILDERDTLLGIDGNDYPIPTLEQITQRLYERREELSTKRDQGFIKLLLVPFGMSLDALRDILRQFLLTYRESHPTDFYLDTIDSLFISGDYIEADISDDKNIVYYPKSFDRDHRGQTKLEILEEQENTPGSTPGWTIHLLQASQDGTPGFRVIPRQGKGKTQGKEIPRPELEAKKTAAEYLSILQQAQDDPTSPYFQESGMTPEDWILAFMIHLEVAKKPLDDYVSGESISYLVGAFFPALSSQDYDNVPDAFWSNTGQVYLGRDETDKSNETIGIRTSVVV